MFDVRGGGTQRAPPPAEKGGMSHLAEAPTAEPSVFVRHVVFEAYDCCVEVIRSGRDGRTLAVVVVAREGVSVGRVEPSEQKAPCDREGAG